MFGVASQTDKNVLGENVADGALILLSTSLLQRLSTHWVSFVPQDTSMSLAKVLRYFLTCLASLQELSSYMFY